MEPIEEARHQVKRVYGEHKRIRINEKGATVRDTIIKYVGKNYIREEDLNNYLVRLEEDRDGNTKINKPAWFKRNTKFFNTFEKAGEKFISLSKYGQRVLELLNTKKEVPKSVNESHSRNIPSLDEWIAIDESEEAIAVEEVNEGKDMVRVLVAELNNALIDQPWVNTDSRTLQEVLTTAVEKATKNKKL